jgi:hypothetical protein
MHAQGHTFTAKDVSIPAGHWLGKLPLIGLVLAVIGFGASAALAMQHKEQFYFSYLVAFVYWASITLGGMFFVIIQYATKAGWSVVVRRVAEFLMAVAPYLIVLFVPIALGVHTIYHHWADAALVAADPLLQGKQPWLNEPFFLVRAVIYLLVWTTIALVFFKGSTKQDASGDEAITSRLTTASYPALLFFALSVTFAALDWIMSLDPHWYSTIFGVYYFAGSVVAAFASMILLAHLLRSQKLVADSITAEHFHDLGKLLFAFVVFWTYIAFSQYMLMWYANIPEETIFYRERMQGGWENLTYVLAGGHFVIPFFFLMSRTIKRVPLALNIGALWMLGMHYLDLFWLVTPMHSEEMHFSLMDLTTFVGVGGVFIFAIGRAMNKHALVPVKDPRLHESLAFENM